MNPEELVAVNHSRLSECLRKSCSSEGETARQACDHAANSHGTVPGLAEKIETDTVSQLPHIIHAAHCQGRFFRLEVSPVVEAVRSEVCGLSCLIGTLRISGVIF